MQYFPLRITDIFLYQNRKPTVLRIHLLPSSLKETMDIDTNIDILIGFIIYIVYN